MRKPYMDFGHILLDLVQKRPGLATPLTVSAAVREEVNFDLSVQDAIARDYVNLSKLARKLRPAVERRTGRRVGSVESIITSLKRLRDSYSPASSGIGRVIAGSVVHVRTHVSKLSVEKTKRALELVGEMLSKHREEFIQVSESVSAITLIFDQRLHKRVRSEMGRASILEEGDFLAAIIVQSPPEIISTPGCVMSIYNHLARRHVNIEDTVSCYTDTIVVVKMDDVGKAFEALTGLINEEREKLGAEAGARPRVT